MRRIGTPRGVQVVTGRLWFQRSIAVGEHVIVLPDHPVKLWYRKSAHKAGHAETTFVRIESLKTGVREAHPAHMLAPAHDDPTPSLLLTVTGASA